MLLSILSIFNPRVDVTSLVVPGPVASTDEAKLVTSVLQDRIFIDPHSRIEYSYGCIRHCNMCMHC